MNLENVHYNAFISYRHCDIDKFVAENLHRRLESFKLPKSILKEHPKLPRKLERVFRDQEELPLTANLADPINIALQNSDYLIVICTPRLRESLWCQKEIETFIELHGRSRVFAVLAEGEPEDSFPYQLLVDDEGYPVEPLGADFRGNTKKEILHKMKTESLRLIAPMFGLNFDDLRQRHKEQKIRRILFFGSIAMAVVLLFGIFSGIMALKIKNQANELAKQNDMIIKQSDEIETQAHDIALKYALSVAESSEEIMKSADRTLAVKSLREVLPTDKEDKLVPYTAECQRALTACMGIYAIGDSLYPTDYYEENENIDAMSVSEDGRYLVYISDGLLKSFDLDTNKQLCQNYCSSTATKKELLLIGTKAFYPGQDASLVMTDIASGESLTVFDMYGSFKMIDGYDCLGMSIGERTLIIDSSTGDIVKQLVDEADSDWSTTNIAIDDDKQNIVVSRSNLDALGGLKSRVLIYAYDSGALVDELSLDDDMVISSMLIDDNILYMSVSYIPGFMDTVGYIWTYDMAKGQYLYKNRVTNHELEDMRLVEQAGDRFIFVHDTDNAYTLNPENAAILYSENTRDTIIKCYSLSKGSQMLILEDSQLIFYDTATGFMTDSQFVKYPYFDKLWDVSFTKGLFTFLSRDSGRIGIYRFLKSPGLEEYEGDAYAKLSSDNNIIELGESGIRLCYEDYLATLRNEEDEIIADVPGCVGYDEATGKLIFDDSYTLSAIPLYSYEDILKAADEYLG